MATELPQFAPDFEKRSIAQKILEAKVENVKGAHHYSYYFGEYRRSLESLITSLTRDLLKIKKEPVVVMDVGGGIGGSWLNIASAFNTEIHNSKLALVVSNLRVPPEKFAEKERLNSEQRNKELRGIDGQYSGALARDNRLILLKRKISKKRVIYVTGSTSDLLSKQITLPNKQSIPLLGNVDILHEHISVTAWSLIPEIDIVNLSRLMSSHSMYFVPAQDTYCHQGIQEYGVSIAKGVDMAHKMLQREFKLTRCTLESAEIGNYVVFRKPNSPTSQKQLKGWVSIPHRVWM